MTIITIVFLIFFSMLFSAFFSGLETAFYQANPLKLAIDQREGSLNSKILTYFSKKSSRFITNTLTGNNISLIVFGIAFTNLTIFFYPESGIFGIKSPITSFITMTVLSGLILLLFCEFLPKSLFIINPNKNLANFILPFFVVYVILYPLNWLITNFSNMILFFLRIKSVHQKLSFDYSDLFRIVEQKENAENKENQLDVDTKILKNAIELPSVKVRDCMVPRTEISYIDISESIDELTQQFISSPHSKLIVIDGNIDHIIGYVHHIDLYNDPESINGILRPLFIVPESMPVNMLLKKFMSSKTSIGHVVDEYGGTAGIISIEDVLEQIFGEINDEYDSNQLKEVKVSDNEYIFSARHEIDYINSTYNLGLPEGEYTTLGGLILDIYESFPTKGTIIHFDKFSFKILNSNINKIEDVGVKIVEF